MLLSKIAVDTVDEIVYDEIDIDMVIIYLSPDNFGVLIKKYGSNIGVVNDEKEGDKGIYGFI